MSNVVVDSGSGVVVSKKFTSWRDNQVGSIPTNPHQQYRDVYEVLEPYERDASGNFKNESKWPVKRKSGKKIDIQASVNSYYEDTKLENVLRSIQSGSVQTINFDSNIPVTDLTDMPNNNYEAFNAAKLYSDKIEPAIKDLKAKYESQAKEIKAQKEAESLSIEDVKALKAFLNANIKDVK